MIAYIRLIRITLQAQQNTHLKPQFLLLWFSCSLSNSPRALHFHWPSIAHSTATIFLHIYIHIYIGLLIHGVFGFSTPFYDPHVILACKAEVWYLGFSCSYRLCFLICYVKVCISTRDPFQSYLLVQSQVRCYSEKHFRTLETKGYFPLTSHMTQPALFSLS